MKPASSKAKRRFDAACDWARKRTEKRLKQKRKAGDKTELAESEGAIYQTVARLTDPRPGEEKDRIVAGVLHLLEDFDRNPIDPKPVRLSRVFGAKTSAFGRDVWKRMRGLELIHADTQGSELTDIGATLLRWWQVER